jgi:hypothetical protein
MRLTAGLAAVSAVVAAVAGCAPSQSPELVDHPARCDARGADSLIGSHVGAVTFPAGADVRIVCTTCPTTRDYRPGRLNVRFNEATGIIESLDCG